MCFADDAVADIPSLTFGPHLTNDSGELVPQDDWVFDSPALITRPHMDIATADAHGLHFQDDVLWAGSRILHIAQLNTPRLGAIIDDGCLAAHLNSPVSGA